MPLLQLDEASGREDDERAWLPIGLSRGSAGPSRALLRAAFSRADLLAAGAGAAAQTRPPEPRARRQGRGGRQRSRHATQNLRFLTTTDFPPFNYIDEDGQLTGFNVDLARAICLETNMACDVIARPWEDLFGALAPAPGRRRDRRPYRHRARAAEVDFTDRYFHTPGRFAGRRDSPSLEITPDGLEGTPHRRRQGHHARGLSAGVLLRQRLQRFDNPELARDALIAAKVDLVFDDGVSLVLWLNGTGSKECCEFKGGPFLEPKYFGDGIASRSPRATGSCAPS